MDRVSTEGRTGAGDEPPMFCTRQFIGSGEVHILTMGESDCVGPTFHSHNENYPVRLLSESNRNGGSKHQGGATRVRE